MVNRFFGIADVVSYKPYISTFNNDRYKSTFGIIVGIISIILIFTITLIFMSDLVTRKEITLIFNELKVQNKPVNFTQSPLMFSLRNSVSYPISRKLYDIRINFWNYTKNKQFIITEINLEPCDINKHFGDFKNNFNEIDISNELCVDKKYDLSLIGSDGNSDSPYSFINIVVNMCNNKTTNNTCPSESELELELNNVYLSFQYINYEINHFNKSCPVNHVINRSNLAFNWDLHVRYLYFLKNLEYSTDNGFIFESTKTHYAYFFEKIDQIVSIRHGSYLYPNITIGTLTIVGNQLCAFYNKSYPKIQTLIARIGGVINCILTFAQIMSYFYTKNLYLIDMLNFNFISDDLNKSCHIKSSLNNLTDINIINNFKSEKTINRNFSILDKICPNLVRHNSNGGKIMKNLENIHLKKLSYENLFKFQIDFEKLKISLLSYEKHILFENMKFSLDEFWKINSDYQNFKERFNKIFNETEMINENTNKMNILLRTKPLNLTILNNN